MRRRKFITSIIGAAAVWPFAVRAQTHNPIPKVAVLWHAASAEEEAPYFGSLIEGFESLGYSKAKIELTHRFPNERPELFASMAAELVATAPDVLIAVSAAAPYAKRATTSIPIVFMYVPDPIGASLVTNIRHPGGNVTGLTNFSVELSAKRLEYLKETVPALSRVGLLINPNAKISNLYIEQSNSGGSKLGITTKPFPVRSIDDLKGAFDAMAAEGIEAVAVNAESLFYQGKELIAKFAIERKLPTCVWVREVLEAGALLSYGTDQRLIARRVAVYVDRILKGESPGDIPVEQPSRFELGVNLKTASALGLAVPPTLLARADEVIE